MGILSGNAGLGLVWLRCEASQEAAAVPWVWVKEPSSAVSTCSQPGRHPCSQECPLWPAVPTLGLWPRCHQHNTQGGGLGG